MGKVGFSICILASLTTVGCGETVPESTLDGAADAPTDTLDAADAGCFSVGQKCDPSLGGSAGCCSGSCGGPGLTCLYWCASNPLDNCSDNHPCCDAGTCSITHHCQWP
jgi:hypothetical protein